MLIRILIIIILLSGPVYADNSARIQEITKESQELLNKRQQHLNAIQQIEAELLRRDGALRELQIQDKKATRSEDTNE
jgi:competence protein ComGC